MNVKLTPRSRGRMRRLVLASLFVSMNLYAKERNALARNVALDKKFVLKQGERALVANKIEILFLKITEDSRCPSDVQCGLAGRAVGVFVVSRKGSAPANIQLDANPYVAPTIYSNYALAFTDLTPRPLSMKKTMQNEYAATLLVSKAK